MKTRASFFVSLFLAILAFAGLLIFPQAAAEGARRGLALCGRVIVPSLFPFAAVACMLLELGLPQGLSRAAAPLMTRLFRVSGRGSAAFFLGLCGGYPLGAVTVSELYASGSVDRREAGRLLAFCDNAGPAFIISVAGLGVFSSAPAGFFLYGVHILAAVLVGALLRGKDRPTSATPEALAPSGFAAALTVSVKKSTTAALTVCGFVVFFSVLTALLDASGLLPALCGRLAAGLGLELHYIRGLLTGLLELGAGAGAMEGLALNRRNLALAAFILGWGGLSVQAQAAAVIMDSGLSPGSHLRGKLLHGLFSAAGAYFLWPLFG